MGGLLTGAKGQFSSCDMSFNNYFHIDLLIIIKRLHIIPWLKNNCLQKIIPCALKWDQLGIQPSGLKLG